MVWPATLVAVPLEYAGATLPIVSVTANAIAMEIAVMISIIHVYLLNLKVNNYYNANTMNQILYLCITQAMVLIFCWQILCIFIN